MHVARFFEAFILLFLAIFVDGKHFRSGTISFSPSRIYTEVKPQLTFTYRLGYKYTFFENQNSHTNVTWRCAKGCPDSFTSEFNIMLKNSVNDWLWGGNEFNMTLEENAIEEELDLTFEGSMNNNLTAEGRSRLLVQANTALRSDSSRCNSSPVTNMVPVVNINGNHPVSSVKIVVADLDNDRIQCQLCPQNGICWDVGDVSKYIKIDKNCLLIYRKPRRGKKYGTLKVALLIKDYPKRNITIHGRHYTTKDHISAIPLHFFLNITPRTKDFIPVKMIPRRFNGSISVHRLLEIPICIFVKYSDRKRKFQLLVLGPRGLTYDPLGNCSASPVPSCARSKKGLTGLCSTMRWIPTSDQVGAHVVCYTLAGALPMRQPENLQGGNAIYQSHHCQSLYVTDVCYPNKCQNGGVCVIKDQKKECKCEVGFEGKKCETENKECRTDNHCWNGFCATNVSRYASNAKPWTCLCRRGYEGYHCDRVIDQCSGSPCAENAVCSMNSPGSFSCVCKSGYRGDPKKYCTGFCNETSFPVNGVNMTFPGTWTKLISFSTKTCDNRNRSQASVLCVQSSISPARFDFDPSTINYLPCGVTFETIGNELNSIKNYTHDTVGRFVDALVILTATSIQKNESTKVARVLNQISEMEVRSNLTVLTNFANVASNLLQLDLVEERNSNESAVNSSKGAETSAHDDEEDSWAVKQKIINSVLNMGTNVDMPNDKKSLEIDTLTLTVEIQNIVCSHDHLQQGENRSHEGGECDNSTVLTPHLYSDIYQGVMSSPVSLLIPSENYRHLVGKCVDFCPTPGESPRASLVVHKSNETRGQNVQKVVATSISALDTSHLPAPIAITFRFNEEEANRSVPVLKCGFWDVRAQRWSSRGCRTKKPNPKEIVCECDHMTTFALLMNVDDEEFKGGQWELLHVLSDVACLLSAGSLALTILIHLSIKQIRVRRPTPIIVNLCFCLLAIYLIFYFGIESTIQPVVCHVTAITLHWLLLSAWCWMAVYNYSMYLAFVTLLNYVRRRFWCTVSTFAYGVPTLVVSVAVGYYMVYQDGRTTDPRPAAPENASILEKLSGNFSSAYLAPNVCWLHEGALYYTFMLPVGLLLFYNLVVFYLVLRRITWKRKIIQSTAKRTSLCHEVMLGVSLAACLGLPWIFGYLMMISDRGVFRTIMSWLFTIMNASQGVSIFAISCLRQQNVRKLWSHAFLRIKLVRKMSGHPRREYGSSINSQTPGTKMTRMATYHHSNRRFDRVYDD